MKKYIFIVLVIAILFVLLLSFGTKKDNYFKEITMSEYSKLISDKKDFVLVISQDGCSHCKAFLPIAKKVANDKKVLIYDINITNLNSSDKNKLASTYNLKSTPTTIFIKSGKEEDMTSRIISSTTEEKLIERLRQQGFIK